MFFVACRVAPRAKRAGEVARGAGTNRSESKVGFDAHLAGRPSAPISTRKPLPNNQVMSSAVVKCGGAFVRQEQTVPADDAMIRSQGVGGACRVGGPHQVLEFRACLAVGTPN